jgi:hypothetical protein
MSYRVTPKITRTLAIQPNPIIYINVAIFLLTTLTHALVPLSLQINQILTLTQVNNTVFK